MKAIYLLFLLSLPANATVHKRDTAQWKAKHQKHSEDAPGLTLCPDSTYVSGDSCVLCVDGTYKDHECQMGPNGRYY